LFADAGFEVAATMTAAAMLATVAAKIGNA
jgi:hypothetical protein